MFPILAKRLAPLGVVIALASCSAGTDFSRPAPDSFALGETTKSEVLAEYGEPWRKRSQIANEQSIENIVYAFSDGGGGPHVSGVQPTRALDLFFHKDNLVGYSFMSSYESDHTDFDKEQLKRLKEGDDCRKAVDIYGPPPTEYIYPLTDQEGVTVYSYGNAEVRSGLFVPDFYVKNLSIKCDASGKIKDVRFSETVEE